MGKKSWGEILRTTGVKFEAKPKCRGGTRQPQCREWHFEPDGSKQKILTRREYFASDHYANGLPPAFFTHFGRARAENYESVFLTIV